MTTIDTATTAGTGRAWEVLRQRAREMLAQGVPPEKVMRETGVPLTELAVIERLEQYPPTPPVAQPKPVTEPEHDRAEIEPTAEGDQEPVRDTPIEPEPTQAQDEEPDLALVPVPRTRRARADTPPETAAKDPEPGAQNIKPAAHSGVDALLEQADTSAQPKARQLAQRIRAQAGELRDLLAHEQQVADAQAAVEAAEAQLAAARARLREAKSPAKPAAPRPASDEATSERPATTGSNGAPGSAPAAAGEVDMVAARAWLRENGFTVADRGRLPSFALNAYLRAQRIAAEGPDEDEDGEADD